MMNAIKREEVLYVANLVVPLTPKGTEDLWSALRSTFGAGDKETLKFGSLKHSTAKKPARVDSTLATKSKDLALTAPVRTGYWLADTAEKLSFDLLDSEQVASVCPADVKEWLDKFEAEKPEAEKPKVK